MDSEDEEPSPQPTIEPPEPERWGYGAIAICLLGLLIVIPAGLATGAFLVMAIETGPFFGILPTVLVFGVVPLLIGLLVIRAGVRRHRRERG